MNGKMIEIAADDGGFVTLADHGVGRAVGGWERREGAVEGAFEFVEREAGECAGAAVGDYVKI